MSVAPDLAPAAARAAASSTLDVLWRTFEVNRQLTFDLLREAPEAALTWKWPRPGLDTLAKHIRELAAVEVAFGEAFTTGVMDFSTVPDVFAFEEGAERADLIAALEAADAEVAGRLAGPVAAQVRWDDLDVDPAAHLTNLISHEVFHQGQIALAWYVAGFKLPESWAFNWALPRP